MMMMMMMMMLMMLTTTATTTTTMRLANSQLFKNARRSRNERRCSSQAPGSRLLSRNLTTYFDSDKHRLAHKPMQLLLYV
eukprot:1487391-Amphidinium_carterae.1